MLAWWSLSTLSYPLIATSIIRHTASIGAGVLFFLIGHRMVTRAAELLQPLQYDSILVLVDAADQGLVVRAAAARTESRSATGLRHLIATVAASYVRDSAETLINESMMKGGVHGDSRGLAGGDVPRIAS